MTHLVNATADFMSHCFGLSFDENGVREWLASDCTPSRLWWPVLSLLEDEVVDDDDEDEEQSLKDEKEPDDREADLRSE